MQEGYYRIIPANTGRMVRSVTKVAANGDHPREYGENVVQVTPEIEREGSSPRIRGEWVEDLMQEGYYRIIPANTGRILHDLPHIVQPRDHPREYGENHKRSR